MTMRVLTTIAVMFFACGFVAQFALQGVTLFLRSAGAPSSMLGLLYVAAIPYTLRFVWAPLIDRVRVKNQPRFRPWIIGCQAAICVLLAVMLLTDPAETPRAILIAVASMMFVLGTQLTALGGLIAEGLDAEDYHKGASVQGAASALAGFVLGAFVLFLLGDLGWQVVVATLLAVSTALLLAAMFFLDFGQIVTPDERPSWLSQLSIFGRPQPRLLFLLSVLISISILFPYASKSVLLVDAGFSVSQGGLIGIVAGNLFAFLGAYLAKPFIERFGAFNLLIAIGLCNIAFALGLAFLVRDGINTIGIAVVVLWSSFAVFATFTANRSIILRLCRPGRQATEMASFTSVEAMIFLALAGAGISALDQVGLAPLMLGSALISIGGVALAMSQRDKFQPLGSRTGVHEKAQEPSKT